MQIMPLSWKIYGFITIIRMLVTKCKPLTQTTQDVTSHYLTPWSVFPPSKVKFSEPELFDTRESTCLMSIYSSETRCVDMQRQSD